MQWGFGESPYATPTTYTYPLAYSVNALNVVIGSVGGRESTCRINSVSKDSFIAYRHYSGSGTGSGELLTMELLPTAHTLQANQSTRASLAVNPPYRCSIIFDVVVYVLMFAVNSCVDDTEFLA